MSTSFATSLAPPFRVFNSQCVPTLCGYPNRCKLTVYCSCAQLTRLNPAKRTKLLVHWYVRQCRTPSTLCNILSTLCSTRSLVLSYVH